MSNWQDGFYWCRAADEDSTLFVALRSRGAWFVPGVDLSVLIPDHEIIERVSPPDRKGMN